MDSLKVSSSLHILMFTARRLKVLVMMIRILREGAMLPNLTGSNSHWSQSLWLQSMAYFVPYLCFETLPYLNLRLSMYCVLFSIREYKYLLFIITS